MTLSSLKSFLCHYGESPENTPVLKFDRLPPFEENLYAHGWSRTHTSSVSRTYIPQFGLYIRVSIYLSLSIAHKTNLVRAGNDLASLQTQTQ